MERKFKHLKTGNIYYLVRDDVINCTNANSEQKMVLYRKSGESNLIFVREKEEFFQKFEEML